MFVFIISKTISLINARLKLVSGLMNITVLSNWMNIIKQFSRRSEILFGAGFFYSCISTGCILIAAIYSFVVTVAL